MNVFKNFLNRKPKVSKCNNNTTLTTNYNIPLRYNWNQENVQNFLNNSSLEIRNILNHLLSKTIHVSYDEFENMVYLNFQYFLRNYKGNRPLHVFVYDTPDTSTGFYNKSNAWVLSILSKKFQKQTFNIIHDINSDCVHDGDTILLLDDCVYSGQQIGEEVIYKKMQYNEKKNLQICVLAPYISNEGKDNIIYNFKRNERLRDNMCLLKIFSLVVIKPIHKLLGTQQVAEFETIFKFYDQSYKGQKFKYAIYFDHKLADDQSTWPLIYSGVVPNKYNMQLLQKINKTKYILRDKYIGLLEIYPLLKYCQNQGYPDIWNTPCPYPPYKKDYHKFLATYNKPRVSSNIRKTDTIPQITLTQDEERQYKTAELNNIIQMTLHKLEYININLSRMDNETDKSIKWTEGYYYKSLKQLREKSQNELEDLQQQLQKLKSTGGSKKKQAKPKVKKTI
jgi:hypothetical protein